MQISLSKLTKVTSLKTILKIAPGKDSLCFDFFEKRFLETIKRCQKRPVFCEIVKFRPWMLILLLLIGTSSVSSDFGDSRTFILSLCFIIFLFEFDFLEIRTQFMVSVMTHYALIFSFILCFLLMFYSENEFGSLKWRKTLKWQPTHEMRNASFSSISDHV